VLLELGTPILFIQGSRDALCPLDRLAAVRKSMSAPNDLHVVAGGDHSLRAAARALAAQGRTPRRSTALQSGSQASSECATIAPSHNVTEAAG